MSNEKGLTIKGSTKKLLFTSMAAVALLSAGSVATASFVGNVNPVHAATTGGVTLNNVVVTVTKDGAPYNLNIGTVTAVPGGKSVLLPAPKIDGYTVSGTNINGEFEVAIRPDGSHVDMLTGLTYTKNNGGASSSSSESSSTPSSSSSKTPSSSTSSTSSSKESTPSSSTSTPSKADTTSSTPSKSLTTSAETSSKAAVPAATTNAAKESIDSMNGLTDGQKAAATSAVDSATTPAGDVQTGVNSGVFAAIAGGFTALMSGVGLAFRKLH